MTARLRLVALVLLVLVAAPVVRAQTHLTGRSASIGATPTRPSGTSVRITDLQSSGTGLPLFTESDGDMFRRALGKSDLPGVVGYTDATQTWSLLQSLSGGAALADGTAGTPGLRWISDLDTGLWRPGADILGLSTGGTERARVSSAGLSLSVPLITPSGPLTLGPADGKVRTSSSTTTYAVHAPYLTDVGELLAPVRTLYASELSVGTLTTRERITTTGGDVTVGLGNELVLNLAAADTCVFLKYNSARVNDWLHVQARGQIEYLKLGSGPYDCRIAGQCSLTFDAYAYCSLTRGTSGIGTGPHDWLAGDAAFNTGNTGDGWLNLYAERSSLSSGYYGQILVDRPVLFYPMDEASGTTLVARVGPNGSYTAEAANGSGASWNSNAGGVSQYHSVAGNLATVTGVNSYVSGTGSVSFEFAVYADANAWSTSQHLLMTGATSDPSAGYWIATGQSVARGLRVTLGNGTSRQTAIDTAALWSNNTWRHIVVVVDRQAARVRLYVDGALNQDVALTLTGDFASTANALQIDQQVNHYFDHVAIYNRVLTADDVARHYAARASALSTTLVGPAMTAWARTGSNARDQAARLTVGNLNGTYGYTSTTWGMAAGDPAATWISADATNGFRVMHGTTAKLHGKTNGDLDLAGSLNLVTGGSIASSGHWSIATATGLTFVSDLDDFAFTARGVGWTSSLGSGFGGRIVSRDTTGNTAALLWIAAPHIVLSTGASAYTPGTNNAISLWGTTVELGTPYVLTSTVARVQPPQDGNVILGNSTRRFANIHLDLPAESAPGYLVVGNSTVDATRLAYFAGFTGTKTVRNSAGSGTCTLIYQIGVLTGGTC